MGETVVETTATGLESAIGAMSHLPDLLNGVWSCMAANPLIVLFVATSLFGIGIAVFKKVKRAAK